MKSPVGGDKRVNVGIIGAGNIANKAHIPNFNNNKNCQIISICSKNKKNALLLSKKYDILHVDDNYKSLLKRTDIDAVSICTPPYTHKEIIRHAVLNNRHILVEKPIAVNLEETKWIIEKTSNYSKKFMVAFNNRHREENNWLINRIKSGDIGTLHFADLEWLRTKREIHKEWLFKKKMAGGGVFADLGVHLLDYILNIIPNRETYSIYSRSKKINSYDSSDVEDMVSVIITINDNILINLRVGWTMALKDPARVALKFYGDSGEISNFDYKGNKSNGYRHQIDDFIDTIIHNKEINHKRYLDTMILLDGIYTSCEKKIVITGNF